MAGPASHQPETRALQWGTTALVGAALAVVLTRVVRCLGDDACTFATGALKTAIFAFVGGPFLVLTVWAIPAWLRRRAGSGPLSLHRRIMLPAVGILALAVGLAFLDDGGPAAAVLPALGPGLILGGVLVLVHRDDS